jgi:predicted AAA+ superfamily ATPase
MLIYATSNRRHLARVHDGKLTYTHRGCVHPGEVVERRFRCLSGSACGSVLPVHEEYLTITAQTVLASFGVTVAAISRRGQRRWCGRWSAARAVAAYQLCP